MATPPSFRVLPHEKSIIDLIADRAEQFCLKQRLPFDKLSMVMDITAVHANGCPLRLADLVATDDFNFTHDVFNIRRHLDRDTGQLTDGFEPRFRAKGVAPD